jgi:hypothetical protein
MNDQMETFDEAADTAIRTGIQAGDGQVFMGSGGATSGGGDSDPSRGGGALGSGT